MKRALLICIVFTWLGCGYLPSITPMEECRTDDECSTGEICLSTVCANPAGNIVVEVIANTQTGHHAQDVDLGEIGSTENIIIDESISLIGEIVRKVPPPSPVEAIIPYAGAFTVFASGESVLLPGIPRRFVMSVPAQNAGIFSMFIGAGNYLVSIQPEDLTIPQEFESNVVVSPGQNQYVNLTLSALNQIIPLQGRLYQEYSNSDASSKPINFNGRLFIQAFEPNSSRPLSQRVPIEFDTAAPGQFSLSLHPRAATLDKISLIVQPEAFGQYPSKEFFLKKPLPTRVNLEMGSFGEYKQALKGILKDSFGQPVQGATIQAQGTLSGGASFISQPVITDVQGVFALDAFPGSYNLSVYPPHDDSNSRGSGLPTCAGFVSSVRVLASPDSKGSFLQPNSFECPPKKSVSGWVSLPSGIPASGVRVTAVPQGFITQAGSPREASETVTDSTGRYEFALEPGNYRIDFIPASDFPMRSQNLIVEESQVSVDTGIFVLSNGRVLSGTVLTRSREGTLLRATPNATLRFFFLAENLDEKTPVLIGQTAADEAGNYSVLIPSR